jgi:hypothetical protein
MSRVKPSVLVVGLFVVAAVAFVGASSVATSVSKNAAVTTAPCDMQAGAKAVSPHATGGCCARTAKASTSCPVRSASTDAGKGCPMSSSGSKAGCSPSCTSRPSKTATLESIDYREGKTLVLTGRYVCGTCELGVGDNCQPAFRTTDGKNYLLMRNNLSKQLRSDARDKDVEIVTRVRKFDGTKYLEVEAVRTPS